MSEVLIRSRVLSNGKIVYEYSFFILLTNVKNIV